MEEKILEELGLTGSEVKVYLALLRLGESTSGPLVDESGISVSKIYIILEKLTKKGLAGHSIKQKTKYFFAAPPSRLLDYHREKEEDLKNKKKSLLEMVENLQELAGSSIRKETVQLFQGLKGIQTSRERTIELMKKGDEMWIIGISKTPYEGGNMIPYFHDFHTRRSKKGIKCKYIYNDYVKEIAKNSSKYKNSEVRIMPKGIVTHAWIEVYASTVSIGINLHKSMSIVIDNKDVADSFREYAKLLWTLSKPLKI